MGNYVVLCIFILYGYESIPINTILRGMNIHLPAILMFTRGTRFWPTAIWSIQSIHIAAMAWLDTPPLPCLSDDVLARTRETQCVRRVQRRDGKDEKDEKWGKNMGNTLEMMEQYGTIGSKVCRHYRHVPPKDEAEVGTEHGWISARAIQIIQAGNGQVFILPLAKYMSQTILDYLRAGYGAFSAFHLSGRTGTNSKDAVCWEFGPVRCAFCRSLSSLSLTSSGIPRG